MFGVAARVVAVAGVVAVVALLFVIMKPASRQSVAGSTPSDMTASTSTARLSEPSDVNGSPRCRVQSVPSSPPTSRLLTSSSSSCFRTFCNGVKRAHPKHLNSGPTDLSEDNASFATRAKPSTSTRKELGVRYVHEGTLQALKTHRREVVAQADVKLKGEGGETIFTGDLLEPYRDHIQNGMFHGFDFDATMLRIASMNLMLHGVENPDIHYQDTLSNSFPEKFPKQAIGGFDVIRLRIRRDLATGDYVAAASTCLQ